MGGQIVDSSVAAAPKRRNTKDEKRALCEGRIPDDWARKPAKLRQKGNRQVTISSRPTANDARWTVKQGKVNPGPVGMPRLAIAVPVYGY